MITQKKFKITFYKNIKFEKEYEKISSGKINKIHKNVPSKKFLHLLIYNLE